MMKNSRSDQQINKKETLKPGARPSFMRQESVWKATPLRKSSTQKTVEGIARAGKIKQTESCDTINETDEGAEIEKMH